MSRDLGGGRGRRRTPYKRRQQQPPPTTTTGTIPTPTQSGPVDIGQAIEDYLGQAGGSGSVRQPLGVNPEFTVQQPYGPPGSRRAPSSRGFDLGGGPGGQTRGPRYFADDEYAPANYQANIIAKMQREMASVGLFDTNATIISGDWGEESASAFRRLLAYANQHGLPWQVALYNMRAQIGAGSAGLTQGTGGRFRIDRMGNIVPVDQVDREPLVIRTTDPRTLNILFREMSMNLLGQALSPDQVQGMTAAYNQMEAQRQQQAYDAQVTGGTVPETPTAEAFGQAQIEAIDPTGVAANRGVNYLDEAMASLASPAWGI